MKKAQAAMEFLMTYGWAILVVLVVVGALGYFGVLSPTTLLPEKCIFGIEFACKDFSVKLSPENKLGIDLQIQNNLGNAIELKKIEVLDENKSPTPLCLKSSLGVLGNGQSGSYSLDGCTGTYSKNEKKKFYLVLTYNKQGSTLEHKVDGELFARIQ